MDLGVSGSNFSRAPEETKREASESKVSRARGSGRGAKENLGSKPKSNDSQPKRMTRASRWSAEVENAFRFQCAGWRSREEYLEEYDEVQMWHESDWGQFVKMLRVKKNANFMYFRQTRECEDKYLNKVKLYEY